MNTYSAYKDSGEQWLGQIPAHWEMHKLGHFLSIFSEKGFPNAQLLSVTREQGVILRDKDNKEENHNFVPDDLSGYKHLSKGDFVINKMKSWQGSYGVSEYDGIVSPAYFTCKLKGVYPDFFSRAIRSKAYSGYFMKYSKGIRVDQWDLDPIALKLIPFALPPIEEQEAMVAYLDEQTAQIDSAIAREQKMIDLLEERKQIIIQQAVTKGLNTNAKMKDSGIEWIGEIPEGWEVRKLKYIGDSKNGLTYSPLDMVDENQGILVLRSSNIQKGKLSFEDNVYVKYAPKKLHVRKGDIIICSRNGSADLVGKCAIIDREMYATFGAFMMRFRSPHNDKYIYYLLSIAISKYKQLFATSTINQLTLGIFADMKVPIVMDELCQQTIVNYLDERLGNINRAIDAREKMIALLQERKQIIINEVVTGKIKVL